MFNTECCILVPTFPTKQNNCYHRICERMETDTEKKTDNCFSKLLTVMQHIKIWNDPSIFLAVPLFIFLQPEYKVHKHSVIFKDK